MMKLRKRGFTLIEALIAIWTMVVAAAAILSTFVSSSQLRIFSENFTKGINACQMELEDIRFSYEKEEINFNELLNTYTGSGVPFSVFNADGTVNSDFGGRIISRDPYTGQGQSKTGMFVELTALVAFRQGSRVVGGSDSLVPDGDSPCQISMTIVDKD